MELEFYCIGPVKVEFNLNTLIATFTAPKQNLLSLFNIVEYIYADLILMKGEYWESHKNDEYFITTKTLPYFIKI